jgi:hypothetical protein
MADLRRISCERDSLLEQVKINRENKMCDTVTLEQKVEDLGMIRYSEFIIFFY